jgi:cobalt-zinc-cadmium efflux system membrane fusion protein
MAARMTTNRARAALIVAIIAVAAVAFGVWRYVESPKADLGASAKASVEAGNAPTASAADRDSIDLSDTQLAAVKVEPVEEREFPVEKSSVGSIDFDEDMETQVFTPYQGRIIALYASIGDDVKKGQTLFTIDSPDLLQAESTLIAAVGVMDLTTRNLARLRELYKTFAVSQRDLDQGISDQQTAEGNLRAARDAVRIFGKSDSEIDKIVADRLADPTLVVPSPIDGRAMPRRGSSCRRAMRQRRLRSPTSTSCGC